MARYARTRRFVKKAGRAFYKASGLVNPIKKGKLSSFRVIRDMQKIRELINVEKKKYQQSNTIGTPIKVGQVNGNADGSQIMDITPPISAGTGDSNRTGNSVKIVSFFTNFQVSQQSAANHQNMKVIVELWNVKGIPQTANHATLAKIFEPNNFMSSLGTYIDYFSSRNPDYFSTFKRVAYKTFTLKFDSTTGASGNDSLAHGIIKRKFQHHLRFDPGTTNIIEGQLLMTIRADSGNYSSTTAYTDTGSIPVTAINTGAYVQFNQIFYYVDN